MPATLPQWGVKSAAAYRALIGLGFRWHFPGKTRFPVDGGRTWIYSQDENAYEPLSDAELVTLCFPTAADKNRAKLVQRAHETLHRLEAAGEIHVSGRRVLPIAAKAMPKPPR